MENLLFKIALAAYFFSAIGYITSILVKRVFIAKTSTWVLLSAFAVHTLSIIVRWVGTGYSPVTTIFESLSFIAWAISGSYIAFQLKTKTRVLGAFVSPLAFLLMMVASVKLVDNVSMPAILKGYWVPFHIILSLVGEALFALACLAGVMYLIQDNLIKKKKSYRFTRLLPPLRDLDKINHVSLLWGFPLMTLGVIAGSIWARTVWGSHWQWDPKQIWTMISWFLYAFLLHQDLQSGGRGERRQFFLF